MKIPTAGTVAAGASLAERWVRMARMKYRTKPKAATTASQRVLHTVKRPTAPITLMMPNVRSNPAE